MSGVRYDFGERTVDGFTAACGSSEPVPVCLPTCSWGDDAAEWMRAAKRRDAGACGPAGVCIVARPPEWPWNAGIPKECERITRILDVFGSNPDELQDTCQIHARYT